MRFVSKLGIAAPVVLALLGTPSPGRGDVVVVGARANGGFGSPVDGPLNMVAGHTFTAAGDVVTIHASGLIDINTLISAIVGPDGSTTARSDLIGPFGSAYTPLEEKLVDAGTPPPISDGTSPVLNVGALIGAFVPQSIVSNPQFTPFDEDVVPVGISSPSLFLIGSGPVQFTAPGAGTLFLGINEPFVSNNAGSFSVTILAVPEPSSTTLALTGAAALLAVRLAGWSRRKPDVG
ncbi:MAG: hypothetical protein AB7I30_05030 [Isosphaeraceae bacterium]